MLTVISPAKTLDYTTLIPNTSFTLPHFISDSAELIKECRKLTPSEISTLMKVSDKIASLNAVRFEEWSEAFTRQNSRPCLFAFKGDVYTGLDAGTLQQEDFEYAQGHLRILSGLYGLLRPLDLMQPYRLEMGTKLVNDRGANLYQFWGDKITENLNLELDMQEENILVNLASNEYFKAINLQKLNAKVITPVFKDYKNGQYKVISFHAKKARGLMSRFIIENKVNNIEDLKNFTGGGYQFFSEESDTELLVFKRDLN